MIAALEPIKVPLPPKLAPNDNAHHNGLIGNESNVEAITGLSLSESITGIIVAVNGILSMNALENADNHITIRKVYQGSPFVILIARFESIVIKPDCCAKPTIINRPVKNNKVVQSTSCSTCSGGSLVIISRNAAPPKAIIEGSRLRIP
jgi:hypothetical protein